MSNDAIVLSTAALLGILLIAAALWIAVYVWLAHALSKVFSKLGEEAWKAWVPFLNVAVVLRLGGYPWWWVFGYVVPALNAATMILFYMAVHSVNRRFGKGAGFTVLAILLYPVWVSILGYGSARVVEDAHPIEVPRLVPVVRPVGGERLAGAAWPQAAATAPPTPVAPAVEAAHAPAPVVIPWAPPITSMGVSAPAQTATAIDDAHLDTEATIITGAAASALDDDDEATRIVPRRTAWSLQTADGVRIPLTQRVVLLGRNPKPSFGPADSQLVKLDDPAKTVSQTHARLDLGPDGWSVTDLHSTNGVIVVDAGADEREIMPETPTALAERFQLGDFELRLTKAR